MQYRAHGRASRRFTLISSPQETHSPKMPSRTRTRAASIFRSNPCSATSLRLTMSLEWLLPARSSASAAASSSFVLPYCSSWAMLRRSSTLRTSNAARNRCNRLLSTVRLRRGIIGPHCATGVHGIKRPNSPEMCVGSQRGNWAGAPSGCLVPVAGKL